MVASWYRYLVFGNAEWMLLLYRFCFWSMLHCRRGNIDVEKHVHFWILSVDFIWPKAVYTRNHLIRVDTAMYPKFIWQHIRVLSNESNDSITSQKDECTCRLMALNIIQLEFWMYTLTFGSGKRIDIFILFFRTESCRFFCVFLSLPIIKSSFVFSRNLPWSIRHDCFQKWGTYSRQFCKHGRPIGGECRI